MGVVTFSQKNTVRMMSPKGLPDYEAEVIYVKHALLAFLREDVYDIVLDIGRFLKGNSNSNDVDEEYIAKSMARTARGLFGPRYAAQYFEQMTTNLEKYQDKTAAAFIADVLLTPNDELLRSSAILLIRIGLKTFIEYKQCHNSCYADLDKKHPLRRKCDEAAKEIDQKIREDHQKYQATKEKSKTAKDKDTNKKLDIRDINVIEGFDQLLRKASRDQCSIAPLKPVATIRFGSKK